MKSSWKLSTIAFSVLFFCYGRITGSTTLHNSGHQSEGTFYEINCNSDGRYIYIYSAKYGSCYGNPIKDLCHGKSNCSFYFNDSLSTACGSNRNGWVSWYCARDAGWSGWSPWSVCSASCNSGTRTRSRTCDNPTRIYPGISCSGSTSENINCFVNCTERFYSGSVSGYFTIDNCNASGYHIFIADAYFLSRRTTSGWWGSRSTSYCGRSGGDAVHYVNTWCESQQTCRIPFYAHAFGCSGYYTSSGWVTWYCVRDGGWENWSLWTTCNTNSSDEFRSRTRNCSNPVPVFPGSDCSGLSTEALSCNVTVNDDYYYENIGTGEYKYYNSYVENDNFNNIVRSGYDGRDCPEGRLLPYTTNYCHQSDDKSYGPIRLKHELPACDKFYRTVYVNPNGYIALGKDYEGHQPMKLHKIPADIVAFYWYDFQMIDCNLFINVYEENDNGMLDIISTLVRRRHGVTFRAQWAVVATWLNAYGYPGFEKWKQITFQGVLVTDWYTTYYMAIFKNSTLAQSPYTDWPVLGWKCSDNNPKPKTRHRWYKQNIVFSIHRQRQPLNVWKVPTAKCKGLYVWLKISLKTNRVHPEKKCLDWYKSELHQLRNIRFHLRNWGFRCHCSYWHEVFVGSMQNWHPYNEVTMCFFKKRTIGSATMECCYKNGRLIQNGPEAGSYVTSRPGYWKTTKYRKYMDENMNKKKWCCQKSNNCNLYYTVRPVPNWGCSRRPEDRWGWFWGDPHITTLDNKAYTFNGLGEYIMMKGSSDNSTIELQARTCKALDKDGKPINATIFCAFSGKDETGSTFRVELNVATNRDKMLVFINNEDWTYQFYNSEVFQPDLSLMDVTKKNESLHILLNSGIKYVFSVRMKNLILETNVPSDFNGSLVGLLGNYDGNSSNDFILPNGTALENTSSTERDLFYNFGQHWTITEEESLFNYTSERPFSHYNDRDFVPFFSDEFTKAEKDLADAACQPNPTQACIVDYLMTKDLNFSQSSGDVQSESQNVTAILGNEAPQINGPTEVMFTIGQPTQLEFNASDDSSYSFHVVNQPSSGNFTFDSSKGMVWWTAETTDMESITITAVDDKGIEAAPIDIKILICTDCSGHGVCDPSTVRSGDTTLMHNVLACNCSLGWTGDDCEKDEDACLLSPCAFGQTCIDYSPTKHAALEQGYRCTDCTTGYQVKSNKCEDIDECNTTHNCDQVCSNTLGSYDCTCFGGFRRIYDVCLDIDECTEGTHDCEQVCSNSAGNYTCGCYAGFDINSDNRTCTKVQDVCPEYGLSCSYGCKNNTKGVMVCVCKTGYEIDNDGISCKDTNECEANICNQKCTNSDGSFQCSCYDGYVLNVDGTSCDVCENSYWGPSCSNICDCGDGTESCDLAVGCVCSQYYTGENCTEDLDECTETPAVCGSDKACINEEGSYDCHCLDGFIENDDGDCIDIDECDESESNEDLDEYQHNCTLTRSSCRNVHGGFTCECLPGYNQNGPYICEDIDECGIYNHGCEHMCRNMAGSYFCECYQGFILDDDDRKTCHRVSDPCELYNVSCGYTCVIEDSKPTCKCKSGFSLMLDNSTCQDIDECLLDDMNICDQKDSCENTVGGFNCSCTPGYRLENDGRTCTACFSYYYGNNCEELCNCHPMGAERCDSISGCICNAGWTGRNCSVDINECVLSPSPCPEQLSQICVNTIGSYECRCKTGYSNDTGTCLNIDECSLNTDMCAQDCVDTDGSYSCTCGNGFKLTDDQRQCIDIDECSSGMAECDQLCANSVGSYRCACYGGYLLNTTDRHHCYAERECEAGHNCTQRCSLNASNVEICSCNTGYNLNVDGITCDNVDECTIFSPCSENCTDLSPGFICSCNAGKKVDMDRVTCVDCSHGSFGDNCVHNCTCIVENTENCDKIAGACTCKSGYTGTNCENNIDECLAGTDQCGDHSTCRDTNGSYACDCNAGYTAATATTCIECSDQKYGINCASICSCVTANTVSCNKTNGFCTCKSGWNGTDCGTDINECTENPGICTHGKECSNKDGTYDCKCATGYAVNSTGWCDDVDECFKKTDDCGENANCTNSPGTFSCACKSGYYGNGYVCTIPPFIRIISPEYGSPADSYHHNKRLWQLVVPLILSILL